MERVEQCAPFRGEMLRLARQARAMTQTQLAKSTGVRQAYISLIEEGARTPAEDQAIRFAEVLRFPDSFFRQPDFIMGTGIGEVFHRRRKSLPAKELELIHARMNLTTIAVRRLLQVVDWPVVNLTPWTMGDQVDTPDQAADALRGVWYVPDGPIQSVSNLLDRAGVLTIPMHFSTNEMDAIGQWPDGMPPMMFVNTNVPQDRLRFTLVHELAHLLLHQRSSLSKIGVEVEDEADQFSSAFLMPTREIKPYLRNLTVTKLAPLKRHWKVSMASIIIRARDLKTISPVEERKLWVEFGRNGWKKREPVQLDVAGEDPGRRFRELLSLYRRQLGYTDQQIAPIVHLHQQDVRDLLTSGEPGLQLIG